MSKVRLIDANALKEVIFSKSDGMEDLWDTAGVLNAINNAPTVSEITKEKLAIAYEQGYEDGKNNWLQEERPQGNCENCDYRKFTEKFIDDVVKVMNENGITSVEQLIEMLKGGVE